MKLLVNSRINLPNLLDEISILTNEARISIKEICYNPKERTVKIPLKRREIIGFKRKICNKNHKPIYHKSLETKSILIIHDVLSVDTRNNSEDLAEFTVLFGIRFDSNLNNIYISSIEESRGITLYEMFILVDDINIEFHDI